MVSRSTLIRWGGLAALAAGAMYLLGALSTALDYPPTYLFTRLDLSTVWGVPVRLLMLGGLMGLHARQVGSPGYGRLGAAGFLLAFLGGLLATLLGPLVFSGEAPPSSAGLVVTGSLAVAAELGMLLLGVATLRAAVLPLPWGALPLALFLADVPLTSFVGLLLPAGIGVPVLLHAGPFVLGLGWALLGFALWWGTGEVSRRRPARAR